jgi:stalled ribosome rescue protein Dom34
MSKHYHAVVSMDHQDAKIVSFNATHSETVVIHSGAHGHHASHKANTAGAGHKGVDRDFFNRLVDALKDFGAILLTGPAHAKLEFKNYIDSHAPALAKRVSAVESIDHPTDPQLLAHARKFFDADDKMRRQGG